MFIDTHSHLNLEQFSSDYELVFERMREHLVRTQTVGVDAVSSARAIEISTSHPSVSRALVGIHPAYVKANKEYDDELIEIAHMLDNDICVGVGECGFDYFRCEKSEMYDIQRYVFQMQIEMAIQAKKPLMLHLRPSRGTYDAYDDALELLQQYKGQVVGQAHFFAGTIVQAQKFFDLGFYISCTGVVTFVSDYDELVRSAPLDRLLLETDAPYVAPKPYRGGRCEPWYVIDVYKRIAELKNVPLEQLQSYMTQNVLALYGW